MQFSKISMLALLMSNAQLICMQVEVYSPSVYSPAEFESAFLKLDKDNQTKASAALRGRLTVCSSLVGQSIDAEAVVRIWQCVEKTDDEYLDNSAAQKFLTNSGLMNAGQMVSHSALSTYLSSLKKAVEVMPIDNEQLCEEVAGKEVSAEREFNKTRQQQSRRSSVNKGAVPIAAIPSTDVF